MSRKTNKMSLEEDEKKLEETEGIEIKNNEEVMLQSIQTNPNNQPNDSSDHKKVLLKEAFLNTWNNFFPEDYAELKIHDKILFYVVKLPCTIIIRITVPPVDEKSWDPILASISPFFFLPFIFLQFKSIFRFILL